MTTVSVLILVLCTDVSNGIFDNNFLPGNLKDWNRRKNYNGKLFTNASKLCVYQTCLNDFTFFHGN